MNQADIDLCTVYQAPLEAEVNFEKDIANSTSYKYYDLPDEKTRKSQILQKIQKLFEMSEGMKKNRLEKKRHTDYYAARVDKVIYSIGKDRIKKKKKNKKKKKKMNQEGATTVAQPTASSV